MARTSDRCKLCGSDDLFSGFFGKDGLANDGRDDGRSDGDATKWDTACNGCGQMQSQPAKRGPAPKPGELFVGQHVQMHPSTDAWKRGMRYGRVMDIRGTCVRVVVDGTKLVIRMHIDHLIVVGD